jgi:hypothetical protein
MERGEAMNKLSNGPRGAFGEGADRLEKLAQDVKTQQLAEMQGALPQAPRMSAIAPDEVWAKKFMNQGIGPKPDLIGVSGMTPMPHAAFVMKDIAMPRPVLAEIVKRPAIAETNAPMNTRIGRKDDSPRRSWFGRLLRGA